MFLYVYLSYALLRTLLYHKLNEFIELLSMNYLYATKVNKNFDNYAI